MSRSIKRVGTLIRKETIQLLRDRTNLAMIIVMPIIALFLLAYAVSLSVDHIPTAVADASMDTRSSAFIHAMSISGYFDIEMYVQNESEAIRAIDEGLVKASIVIPPDFAAQVERGDAQVLLLLDGSDSFTVQAGYGAALAICQTHAMELLTEKVARQGYETASLPITSSIRIRYNATMNDMIFLVPALAAVLMQFVALNLTAMCVVRERETGTLEQLLVTPARPMELMIGKLVPNLMLTIIDTLIVLFLGIVWFGVPFQGNWWLFALLSLIFIVSALALGLLISAVAKTQRQAQQIASVLLMLGILLTGFLYPRASMPPVATAVGDLLPLTYFMRIVRGVFTKGVGITFLWKDVIALVIYAVLAMVMASLTFKKRLD